MKKNNSFSLVPLQCQINIQQIDIHHGLTQDLSCSINSLRTNSSDHWQWYHNSRLLSTKSNRYTVTNATRKHMGMYQCCYMRTSTYTNGCCAQTQMRIISKSYFFSFFSSKIFLFID